MKPRNYEKCIDVKYILTYINNYSDPRMHDPQVGERSIWYQPVSHVYGIAVLMANLCSGWLTLVMHKFDLCSMLKAVQDCKVLSYMYIEPFNYNHTVSIYI